MAVNPSAFGPKPQFELSDGTPAVGGRLFFYVAGSVGTKQNTYTDSTGGSANTNPVVLNALGTPTTEIWWTAGLTYKVVYAPPGTDDPPNSPIFTVDNLRGINDTTNAVDQWLAGPTPTFVSTTSFTLVGDQTGTFHVGRRVKTTNTGGTVYSTITASVFGAATTVTIENDSSNLDAGLSAVSYGLISQVNGSAPAFTDQQPVVVNITDRTKRQRMSAVNITAGKTRVMTLLDQDFTVGALARSYLAGLTLSTAGSSATMSIAAGQATDSTNAAMMTLGAFSKTTGAWVLGTGNGGLDTGAIANTTWYHFWVVMRPDTGVVDVLISLSATAPTMPANYTLKRRIGSGKTDGSAQWVAFIQDGDLFQLNALVNDINAGNPGAAAVTNTLASVPTGVNVIAVVQVGVTNTGVGGIVYSLFTDLSVSDQTPSVSQSDTPGTQAAANWVQVSFGNKNVRTNTSAQIRSRISFSDGSVGVRINTLGWIDRRGRDS